MEVNGIRYFNAPFTEVLDTGDKDLMKRFVEDSYAKRNQLCHGQIAKISYISGRTGR